MCCKKGCLWPETLFKKILWHWYFPVSFFEFFKKTFFNRTLPVAASNHKVRSNDVTCLLDMKAKIIDQIKSPILALGGFILA